MDRRDFMAGGAALALLATAPCAGAEAGDRQARARDILETRIRLTLELIRHTPTMTPPVASRALAWTGIAAFEAVAATDPRLRSLSGQVQGLPPLSPAPPGLDPACLLEATLAAMVQALFSNTGPTGQRAMKALSTRLGTIAAEGLATPLATASRDHGAAIAAAILAAASGDGGAVIENLGFPRSWTPGSHPGHWQPTSTIALQQAPLLPDWGRNRPFAMPSVADLSMPGPTPYTEEPGSPFHSEALVVVETSDSLTPEQAHIARFWADDAMLSFTPPGHWIAILMQVSATRAPDLAAEVEALARTGIAMADGFIGCWAMKYRYDTVRPVTYIRKVIRPGWQPLLNTPPFPEYPSGHSVQSAAAAAVLTHLFGENFAFTDESPAPDGVPQRAFASFDAAAEEAGMSRLYGGIHFRPAIRHGQALGRQIAAHAIALGTRA